jgi:hypothetical protein
LQPANILCLHEGPYHKTGICQNFSSSQEGVSLRELS